MALRLKANRRFPSIPVVTDDPVNHTQVLMGMKEALDIGQRRTGDLLNSFIRVEDLIDLGLITIEGNTNSVVGADLSEIANIGDLSGSAVGDFLRFDGTDWVNDQLTTGDITQSMVTQHQAALSLTASQISNFNEAAQDAVGGILIDTAEIDFTYDDATPTISASLISASVAFSKIQNVATNRIIGRITAGSGSVESLTGTQATTLLDAFTSTLKGLAPASGGGSTNFLRADGTWAAPAGATAADPSASVGLAAVNGVATTYMRSDAAPQLSQSIAPTWTGDHRFNSGILMGTGATAATSLIRPVADATLYSLLGRSQAGPGIQGRWDSSTTDRYLAFGVYDNLGAFTEAGRFQEGSLILKTANTVSGVYALEISSAEPGFTLEETGVAADNGKWDFGASGQTLRYRAISDDFSAAGTWMQVTRSASAIASVMFPRQAASALLIGTTSSLAGGNMAQVAAPASTTALLVQAITNTSPTIASWNTATSGDNSFVTFYTEASPTLRGSISYNRGAGLTSYNTTSDARRKRNIRDSSEASEIIDAIKVRAFEWIDSNAHLEHWVVAQELYTIFPSAVRVGNEEEDWGVDPSKLIPLVVKEVQSLRRRLAIAENQLRGPGPQNVNRTAGN